MRLQLNGRECEAWAEHGRTHDESMFVGGYWLDDETDLTEDELDALTETYPDALYEGWLDHWQDLADRMHDRYIDD